MAKVLIAAECTTVTFMGMPPKLLQKQGLHMLMNTSSNFNYIFLVALVPQTSFSVVVYAHNFSKEKDRWTRAATTKEVLRQRGQNSFLDLKLSLRYEGPSPGYSIHQKMNHYS